VRGRRVAFNALFLDPGVSGGSESYLRALVPALVEAQPAVRFELATTRRGAAALRSEDWAGEVELIELPCDDDEPARRTLVEQAMLPRLARRRRWDLVHSLANRGPRWAGTASVLTVHDVIFFHQRTMSAVSTYGMRLAVRAAVSGADALITVSEAAAGEIAATLGVDRGRIVPIPHGPGQDPVEPDPEAEVRRRFGLEGARVVLCVAAKRRHKNQELLIDALGHLPPDVHLVLAGHDEGYGNELALRASEAGRAERVHLLDYVPDRELEALWAMAACAAFPTLAEGFGLPVLEAMRRGVPVACSDASSLPEVAGDAALLFDPGDARAITAAIERVLGDPAQAARLRAAGLERAALFTWAATARATAASYERALAPAALTRR